MAGEGAANFCAGLDVPKMQVQVSPALPASVPAETPSGECLAAVGTDGEREDCAPMALEMVDLATRPEVPDPEIRVFSGDDDPRSVGCYRKAVYPTLGADPSPQLSPT